MKIRCKLCQHEILSTKPPEEAPGDVLTKMSDHMGRSHRHYVEDLASAVITLYTLAGPHLIFQYVEPLEGESELRASYDKNRDQILAILDGRPVAKPTAQKKVLA